VQLRPWQGRLGVMISVLSFSYVIGCEFAIKAEQWHNVRGAQMILSMKGTRRSKIRMVRSGGREGEIKQHLLVHE